MAGGGRRQQGFRHDGVVVSVVDGVVNVEVSRSAACEGCKAKASCGIKSEGGSDGGISDGGISDGGISDGGGRNAVGSNAVGRNGVGSNAADKNIVRVESSDAMLYAKGDRVRVSISYGVGLFAVLICYVVPLVVFVGSLSGAILMGVDEGLAAILTFITTGLYFWLIHRSRDKFENRVKFQITKIQC